MIDNEKQIENLKERFLVQLDHIIEQQILIDELTEAGEAIRDAMDLIDWTASDELQKAAEDWDCIQEHRQSMADWRDRQNMHPPCKESL